MSARWTQAQYDAYKARTQPKRRRRTLAQIALDDAAARLPEPPADALVLELPMPPRACWPNRRAGKMALASARAGLRRDTGYAAKAQLQAAGRGSLTFTGPVEVSLLYVCTLRRVRDRDGMISAAKALLDGLTDAGVWRDDSQVQFGRVEQFVERGGRERVMAWVRKVEIC